MTIGLGLEPLLALPILCSFVTSNTRGGSRSEQFFLIDSNMLSTTCESGDAAEGSGSPLMIRLQARFSISILSCISIIQLHKYYTIKGQQ